MKFETRNKLLETFSLSSLTDIVLLLLIFFLLSSSFIIQPGIKVKLPQSDTSETTDVKNITITISKEGLVYLNDEEVTITELPAKWRQLMVLDPELPVIIKADKEVTLERAIEVMDIGKKVGARNFNIATERIK
ncbi:MAG: biopolymer transporter ExbD [bacterium]|nr:biopolymer transporter ExbD [bacterium]